MDWRKIRKVVFILIAVAVGLFLSLILLGSVVQGAGLLDETINATNEYSKYSLDNYQLDFFVDTNWDDLLPWNWGSGIGKQIDYGLFALTSLIWKISMLVSSATGYIVQEAFKLDFISKTVETIGTNMQTLAGVTKNGISPTGFYGRFLIFLILVLGGYVAYTGLVKKETTKAFRAIINFIVIFILSTAFIAYAPNYIKYINEFSTDISTESLAVGTKILMPGSNVKGKDSVDLIRDNLFAIQIKQPWLLLQYDNSDITKIGEDRVEKLVKVDPKENNGKNRTEVVKGEIENQKNSNLTVAKVTDRLGVVFCITILNFGISLFVLLLCGIQIFTQLLFIILALFLVFSFLIGMIPTFESMPKKAIIRLFNVILSRAGISLVISIAFSLSSMAYSLTNTSPFFVVMFVQIVIFLGIYLKLGEFMGMFSLGGSDGDARNFGRDVVDKSKRFLRRRSRSRHRKSRRKNQKNQDAQKRKEERQHERDNDNDREHDEKTDDSDKNDSPNRTEQPNRNGRTDSDKTKSSEKDSGKQETKTRSREKPQTSKQKTEGESGNGAEPEVGASQAVGAYLSVVKESLKESRDEVNAFKYRTDTKVEKMKHPIAERRYKKEQRRRAKMANRYADSLQKDTTNVRNPKSNSGRDYNPDSNSRRTKKDDPVRDEYENRLKQQRYSDSDYIRPDSDYIRPTADYTRSESSSSNNKSSGEKVSLPKITIGKGEKK